MDYPIWGALTTRLRDIAEGDGLVWRYPVAIAPFAAVTDLSAASFAALHSLIAVSDRVALFTPEPVVPPDEFEVQMAKTCEQMVGSVPDARAGGPEMVVLGPDDCRQPRTVRLTAAGPSAEGASVANTAFAETERVFGRSTTLTNSPPTTRAVRALVAGVATQQHKFCLSKP